MWLGCEGEDEGVDEVGLGLASDLPEAGGARVVLCDYAIGGRLILGPTDMRDWLVRVILYLFEVLCTDSLKISSMLSTLFSMLDSRLLVWCGLGIIS